MKRALLVILLFFSAIGFCKAQQDINGIGCVASGIAYDYNFNTGQDSSILIQVCITGGQIYGIDSSCTTAGGLWNIRVMWSENINNGSIDVSFLNSHFSKNINIATPLYGGLIDSINKTQAIDTTGIPDDKHCSQAQGGGCNTNYLYQWQQSRTTLDWNDIPGAQNEILIFTSPLTESFYFRRKVIESNSGSIAYSDAAMVFVNR